MKNSKNPRNVFSESFGIFHIFLGISDSVKFCRNLLDSFGFSRIFSEIDQILTYSFELFPYSLDLKCFRIFSNYFRNLSNSLGFFAIWQILWKFLRFSWSLLDPLGFSRILLEFSRSLTNSLTFFRIISDMFVFSYILSYSLILFRIDEIS